MFCYTVFVKKKGKQRQDMPGKEKEDVRSNSGGHDRKSL